MPWSVLRTSLDVLLSSRLRPLTLEFSGGEPLLALPMLRRALRYVEQSGGNHGVQYALTTNGTRLDADTLALLEEHQCEVQLSFHAIPSARD